MGSKLGMGCRWQVVNAEGGRMEAPRLAGALEWARFAAQEGTACFVRAGHPRKAVLRVPAHPAFPASPWA